MNLWQRLEIRGREEFQLSDLWHLYAVDLDKTQTGYAELLFAPKSFGTFETGCTVGGQVKYRDLR